MRQEYSVISILQIPERWAVDDTGKKTEVLLLEKFYVTEKC